MPRLAFLAPRLVRASEAWPAVFGGLIPIIGLIAIACLIIHAIRDNDDDE